MSETEQNDPADLARLLRAIAAGKNAQESGHYIIFDTAADWLTRLQQANAALVEALKPFAAIAKHDHLGNLVADDGMRLALGLMNGNVTQSVIHDGLKVEDFRRAESALASQSA